jgi:hypothetical protein
MNTTGHLGSKLSAAATVMAGLMALTACGPSVTVAGDLGDHCPAGRDDCDGECVDLTSDPDHCGGCNQPCADGAACGAGACDADPCPAGLLPCGSQCVEVDNDSAHCGGCSQTCNPGQSCVLGHCTSGGCPAGFIACGQQCVDPLSDPAHCGGCNILCGTAESCAYGACECVNPVCGICGVEELGSQVPQTKTGMAVDNQHEPSCAAPGSPETVYGFTAPTSGNYSFSTAGSSYDTALYLLNQGCGEIGCNDDYNDLSSLVSVELQGGQHVFVVVDGFGGDAGSFVLTIESTPIPTCPTLALSPTTPQTVSGNSAGLGSLTDGSCVGYGGPEVSYSFTATASGTYIFHTDGSQFDTVLYLRDGSCNGSEIACNDDNIGLNSLVYVPLSQGQLVMVFVDSYGPQGGPYSLSVLGPV